MTASTMPRASALLALLLALAAAAGASAASDCSRIPGCSSCAYELGKASATVLICKACRQGYVLQEKKNACDCAPGYTSRGPDGAALGRCDPAPAGAVAAGGPLAVAATNAKACLANSRPNAAGTACLCDPGHYVLVGGQVPRCVACEGNTYLDAPNTRHACKPCGAGQTANEDRTACVDAAHAPTMSKAAAGLANVTSAVNATLEGLAGRANDTLHTVIGAVNGTLAAVADRVTGSPWSAVTDLAANVTGRVNGTVSAVLDHPLQSLGDLITPGNASLSGAASGLLNLTETRDRLQNITSRLNPLSKARLEKLADLAHLPTNSTARADAIKFVGTVETVVARGTTLLAVIKVLNLILGAAGLG